MITVVVALVQVLDTGVPAVEVDFGLVWLPEVFWVTCSGVVPETGAMVDMDTGMETNPIMVEVGEDFQADEHMEAEEVVDFRPEAQVVEQERLQVSEALEEDEQKRTKQTILSLYLCDVFVRNY